jgi:hypothetical protein
MKQGKIRLSYDISQDVHMQLKIACTQAHIAMKSFLEEWTLKGVEELNKRLLHERLRKGIQEAREGKTYSLGSFAKYIEEDEEHEI